MPAADNPFFVRMRNGVEAAAKEYGVTVKITIANENQAKQMSDVEDLLQSGINALIFVPVDTAAAVPLVEQAVAMKIPVIDLNRRVNSPKYTVRIGSDDVQVGYKIGEYFAKKLNGKGNLIMLIGQAGASVVIQREEGFMQAISKFPEIKILAKYNLKHTRAEGMRVMEDMLQAHSKIDAVYCINDEVALGAMAAIEASKRTGIMISGIDCNPDALAAIKQGKITFSVAQQPTLMGKLGVQYALKAINGETIPHEVVTDVILVDKDNVNTVDLVNN